MRQTHKMVKHTQTICRQKLTYCLSMFDHIVGLALKGLNLYPPPLENSHDTIRRMGLILWFTTEKNHMVD